MDMNAVPSPAGMAGVVGNNSGMNPVHTINLVSPGSVGQSSVQSPANVIAQSPALMSVGAPSPSSMLNTPGKLYRYLYLTLQVCRFVFR